MDSKPLYSAPALEKGLDIIELLAREAAPLPFAALSDRLGRSKSEIFRMVQVLERRGYLLRRSNPEGYVLSNKLFVMGLERPIMRSLVELALPEMRRLTQEIDQSCHLVATDQAEIVIIARMEGPGPMGLVVRVGHRLPLATSASGAVVFAFPDPETQADWLQALRQAGLDEGEFLERVQRIREAGYEVRDSAFIGGVVDISAPILDRSGQALAALTTPFMSQKTGHGCDLAGALQGTREAAMRISTMLQAQDEHLSGD